MPTIIVKTQAELDALPASFPEFTMIEIRGGTQFDRIIIKTQRGSSHVVARGSSHVVARGSCAVHNHGENTTLELGGFVVAWLIAKTKSIKKIGKNCRTVTPERQTGVKSWMDDEAISSVGGRVVIFKRVSADFKNPRKHRERNALDCRLNRHPRATWAPKDQECGAGKFHACSRPYFCDQFRSNAGDRYVAIEVAVKDLFAWPNPEYPHKVAFRSCVVLHECDSFGVKKATP